MSISTSTKFSAHLLTIITLFFCLITPVKGAESIILKYGVLEDSLSVSELSTFSETGKTSKHLDSYLKLAKQNPDKVRRVLSQKIPVNGVMLSRMLNNPVGDLLLDSISEVITTPSETASRQSLRGALVTSAIKDNNLSLMEVIENYPTQEVHVKGDRLLEIYQQIEGVLSKIPPLNI
jgi:hypothetical protein